MLILNFGNKLSEGAVSHLGGPESVDERHHQFVLDFSKPRYPQMIEALEHVRPLLAGLRKEDQLHVILPGSSELSVFLLIGISGIIGHFPKVMMMTRIDGDYLPTERADLQAFKDECFHMRPVSSIKLGDKEEPYVVR